jgi:hypothetical protein
LRCKNEPLIAKYRDPLTVRSPFRWGPDRPRTGDIETTAFYFFSVTNFYRIPKNSFLFQACDDGGRVIRGNFNAGHDFGNAQLS